MDGGCARWVEAPARPFHERVSVSSVSRQGLVACQTQSKAKPSREPPRPRPRLALALALALNPTTDFFLPGPLWAHTSERATKA